MTFSKKGGGKNKKKNPSSGKRQLFTRVKTARGRKSSSTRWLQRQLNDPYVQRAKDEGYRSRSAFKLIEINEKFNILAKGQYIIDLGAAPGGWVQIALSHAKGGKVIGIDLLPMDEIPGAILLEHDFTANDAFDLLAKELGERKADVIISDMAAPTTGHTQTDHFRTIALCEEAFYFAKDHLAPGGSFVAKIFQGGTENSLLTEMKQRFKKVKHFKPQASRPDSVESYVVGLDFS